MRKPNPKIYTGKVRKNLDLIIATTSDVTGIPVNRIMSKERTDEVVMARWIIWWCCIKWLNLTLSGCGKFFGRDHATVIHALEKTSYRLLLDRDRFFRRNLEEVTKELGCSEIVPAEANVYA